MIYLQRCLKDLCSFSVHHCWSFAGLSQPPWTSRRQAGHAQRRGGGCSPSAAFGGAGRASDPRKVQAGGWFGRQSSKCRRGASTFPTFCRAASEAAPPAGLGHGGGTWAASKPVAKSREKSEGLKFFSAPLAPSPSPVRRIQGSQTHPWGM